MGAPLGYYTPWELYIVAVLVAENRLKIDQPRDEWWYPQDTIPVGTIHGGSASGTKTGQE